MTRTVATGIGADNGDAGVTWSPHRRQSRDRVDTIDGMRTFVAVVETGSFTAAGRRLGLSNKLVSKYVAALETRAGAKLLHRTTRSLSLTGDGRTYLDGCREVLASLERLDAAMSAGDELGGTLRVAVPTTFGETVVAAAALRFAREHPGVSLEMDFSDGYVDLAAGGHDLAVRVGELGDSSLVARRLGETALVVVASPGYLARRGRPARPEALAGHECLRDANASDPSRWPFRVGGRTVRVAVAGRLLANNVRACLAFARAGRGVLLCPDVFLGDDLEAGRLVRLLEDFPSGTVPIRAVRLPSAFESPKASAFVEALRAELAACRG